VEGESFPPALDHTRSRDTPISWAAAQPRRGLGTALTRLMMKYPTPIKQNSKKKPGSLRKACCSAGKTRCCCEQHAQLLVHRWQRPRRRSRSGASTTAPSLRTLLKRQKKENIGGAEEGVLLHVLHTLARLTERAQGVNASWTRPSVSVLRADESRRRLDHSPR